MKAITVRLDQSGLDALLQRVRVAQENGFDRFDLCVTDPQTAFGRIVAALGGARIRLAALRLKEERHSALIFRRPGYAKACAPDPKIAERSTDMIIETAKALAELKADSLILDGGYLATKSLTERQAQLDELLDCSEGNSCNEAVSKIVKIDEQAAEKQLEILCRNLHRITKALEGMQVCLLPPESPFGLLQPHRMEHVFSDLKQVGYWHSTSAAALLHKLNGPDAHEWIRMFGPRLKGVYLSDMLGGHGDQPPGIGEVKFEELAPELAQATVRVMVVDDDQGTKLRFGSEYLSSVGIF
jgi:hypothetical protein